MVMNRWISCLKGGGRNSDMTQFHYVVTAEEDGKILKKVLKRRFRFSRRMFRRLKLTGGILVNENPVYLNSLVYQGDRVTVLFDEEEAGHIVPEPIPLNIVHEDDDLIVLNKQPGIVVHPTKNYSQGTLANGLAYYWSQQGKQHRIRPVTRLDRDTSGLLVFAKHAYAHSFLSEQMERGRYQRHYLAICHGILSKEEGSIDAPIARCSENDSRRQVTAEGARAVTHYKVLERYRRATLLSLRLETGRTHQIRVHLAYMGHPIVGDSLYGPAEETKLLQRQALHASFIQFLHPRGGTRSWSSSMPDDMKQLTHRL